MSNVKNYWPYLWKLESGEYEAILTSDGYAFWSVHNTESQGRDLTNEVPDHVYQTLLNGGYITNDMKLTPSGRRLAIISKIIDLGETLAYLI